MSGFAVRRGQVEKWVVSVAVTGVTRALAFGLVVASAVAMRTADRLFAEWEETGGGVNLAAFVALEPSVGMVLLNASQTGFLLHPRSERCSQGQEMFVDSAGALETNRAESPLWTGSSRLTPAPAEFALFDSVKAWEG